MKLNILQTYLDFVLDYAPYFYYIPGQGVDAEWGRGPAPAAHAIEFLYEAYYAKEFENRREDVYNKIVELADYLLSIQCSEQEKLAYGGFKSKDDSSHYYSIDAMRAIVGLLKAHRLAKATNYLEAAKLAGGTFLYNMQHKPSLLGVHDKYYGGFAQAVTIDDNWVADMHVVDLYGLIGLKKLLVRTGETKYQAMMSDVVNFYRSGFEDLYLWFSPTPYGDGAWHRTGMSENLVYDDDFGYALDGLYYYERWNSTVKHVYEQLNTIGSCVEYPTYDSTVCWAGYLDVVNHKPACEYYDCVTAGILYKIRSRYNPSALEKSVHTVNTHPDAFMYWGLKFNDFSPVENKKSVVTVSLIALMLMSHEPFSPFLRRVLPYGEDVMVYGRREINGTVTYSEGMVVKAFVSPVQASEVLIEPGYASNDYIRIYFMSDIAHRDKVIVRGVEYEVGPVEEFRLRDQLVYRAATCRRIIQ